MLSKINHFVRHHPYVTASVEAVFGLTLLALFLVQSVFLSTVFFQIENLASVLPSVLVFVTNEERQLAQIPELQTSEKLTFAAQMKANDMAQKGYFAHTSPEGHTPWFWLQASGYDYEKAGENLAVNFVDSHDVVDSWMDSPTHKANIVNEKYREIGIATATGEYDGREAIFVAQFFGTKKPGVVPQQEIQVSVLPPKVAEEIKKREEVLLSKNENSEIEVKALPIVLGVEDAVVSSERDSNLQVFGGDTFVAFEDQDVSVTDGVGIPQEVVEGSDVVLHAEIPSIQSQFLASPKLLIVLFGLLLLPIILFKIAHGLHLHHPRRVTLGVFLLIVLMVMLFAETQFFIGDIQ